MLSCTVDGNAKFDETQVVQNCTVLCCVWFWGNFEMLSGEIFLILGEAQILIERWRDHYDTKRTHSALGYRPPTPESIITVDQNLTMH